MACQCGLHGNLRRFAVTHFTNHDDVRVLAQDGAQRIGKGQVDLRMHLDLVDAFQLVFHRVFHGDDLVLFRVNLGQGRVQGRRLTRAGRASHQQNTVRAGEQVVELGQGILGKAHGLQLQLHTGAVQHTHHDALAVHRGHGRDTQVQLAAFHAGFDTAVLRQAALGNVQMRHQLNARAHRSRQARRHQLAGVDHTVHAVTHVQTVVKRLQMDVGRAQVGHLANNAVDQADHRRFAGQILQMLNKVAAI